MAFLHEGDVAEMLDCSPLWRDDFTDAPLPVPEQLQDPETGGWAVASKISSLQLSTLSSITIFTSMIYD